MPVYTYECETCKVKVVTGRTVEERDNVPTKGCMCDPPKFVRIIEGSVGLVRGDNWGPGKGKW